MNDQLQKALADLLAKANQGVDAGVSFLQAQLPDVIRQLLLWKFTLATMQAAGLILVSVVFWIVAKVAFRRGTAARALWARCHTMGYSDPGYQEAYSAAKVAGDDDNYIFFGFLAVLLAGVTGVGGFVSIFAAVQIAIAPKLYLIEYAASLAK